MWGKLRQFLANMLDSAAVKEAIAQAEADLRAAVAQAQAEVDAELTAVEPQVKAAVDAAFAKLLALL